MKKEIESLYEGMYVIAANVSDETKKAVIAKIKNDIKETGGEIVKEHDMGRRRLAYGIDKHKEGYYLLLYFKTVPSAINTLWKEYHLTESLLRFMTLKVDDVMEVIEFKEIEEIA